MKIATALALALVVVCAGCAPQAGPEVPTLTPIESETPTPTPTPTVALSKPALSELVLSPEGILTPEGIAPVLIGAAPSAADPEVDILTYQADACEWVLDEYSDFEPSRIGMWVPNYGPHTSTDEPGPFGVYLVDGQITFIGSYSEELRTATGAHLHMTRDELLAVYPDGLEFTHGEGLDVYRLRGTSGDLVFTLWPYPDDVYQVGQIVVVLPGFEVPLGGSDFGVFGVCLGP